MWAPQFPFHDLTCHFGMAMIHQGLTNYAHSAIPTKSYHVWLTTHQPPPPLFPHHHKKLDYPPPCSSFSIPTLLRWYSQI
ncbi:hypothetical protein V6Z11_A05G242500 [Gossypium hirsutum]